MRKPLNGQAPSPAIETWISLIHNLDHTAEMSDSFAVAQMGAVHRMEVAKQVAGISEQERRLIRALLESRYPHYLTPVYRHSLDIVLSPTPVGAAAW